MKKFLMFLYVFAMVFMLPMVLMAQTLVEELPGEFDAGVYVGTLAALGTTTVALAEIFIRKIKATTKWVKQVYAILISMIVAFIASLFGWGMFNDMGILMTLLNGLAGGLIANGLAGPALLNGILNAIGDKVSKK